MKNKFRLRRTDSLTSVNNQQIAKVDSLISATDSIEAVAEEEKIEEYEEDVRLKIQLKC
jgi:hypothetical protein